MAAARTGRGGHGPRALAAAVASVTRPVFGRRGFAGGAIISHWPEIVGRNLAAHSAPERIAHARGERRGGTLHLRIDSGSLATELQHLEPQLIERINAYFGFCAVARIRLVHGPLPRRERPRGHEFRSLDAAEERDLAACVAGVDDDELRAALEGLGRAVARRRPNPGGD